MAKTPINEQFIKMQKLAGVITESQYVTELKKLNENEDPASVWNSLSDDIKQKIIDSVLDGGEGIDDYEEATYDQLRDDMKMVLQNYIKDPSSLAESIPGERHHLYTDSAEIERDEFPFDTDDVEDDHTFESKKSKMTKTELKEAIRQEILAALTEDNLTEADEEEDEDAEEITIDDETEETPAEDAEAPAGGTTSQNVQKELTDALEAAKQLGDKKLVRQIGNALTYFTRQQISTEEV
jgi:hypothetical protein